LSCVDHIVQGLDLDVRWSATCPSHWILYSIGPIAGVRRRSDRGQAALFINISAPDRPKALTLWKITGLHSLSTSGTGRPLYYPPYRL
jgi:hypothetical protein